MIARNTSLEICRLIERKFRDGLVSFLPRFVDIELIAAGKYTVMVWGPPGEMIADVDVEAADEDAALRVALDTFSARSAEEWLAELPREIAL